jgi:selenocysteine lyase/cysteine desulfurase
MINRREFMQRVAVPAMAIPAFQPSAILEVIDALSAWPGSAEQIARDEDYWARVQQAFTVDRSLVNLNNGGVSPSPAIVQEAMKKHLDFSNQAPVHNMWSILEPRREGVRQQLAEFFGCDAEEIALTRNASEGLQISQFGFDLKPGDEVLTTNQDYPRMINTFIQRERRDGIVLKMFGIPIPAEDPAEIVRLFEQNITERTRLILMCHIINITGQILPVKEVVTMARAKGIPVIVDGAHSFAHFEFDHSDLDCDYFATSLHKWLLAPHGTGMLYVRRDRIGDLWPLQAAAETQDDDIRKFEEIGTHPAANYLAIAEALAFHQGIGTVRKEERLRYLTRYWAEQLMEHDRVRLHTSLKEGLSCAIATVQIEGVDPGDLAGHLWKEHRIIVTPIKHQDFEGIRVTPNVYTTLDELDRFVGAMDTAVRVGIG